MVAKQAQLLSLVRSFSEGDHKRFQSVALEVAAEAAQRGHKVLADEIAALIQDARERDGGALGQGHGPIPVVRPRGELAGLVSAAYAQIRLEDMVLDGRTSDRLRRIVDEHRNRAKLAAHGLRPRRKFLLAGPPGTGKSMTAAALAGELGLPLFTILLDGVITKFMGETSAKLRLVFDAMKATRGVYLFDELDALATKRLIGNDVGEARRMLNSILQLLDEDDSDALVVGATNHPELLDPALFRRFDGTVEYDVLPKDRIREVYAKALYAFDLSLIDWNAVEETASGLSQAEMVRAAEHAARTAVMERDARFDTETLVQASSERRRHADSSWFARLG